MKQKEQENKCFPLFTCQKSAEKSKLSRRPNITCCQLLAGNSLSHFLKSIHPALFIWVTFPSKQLNPRYSKIVKGKDHLVFLHHQTSPQPRYHLLICLISPPSSKCNLINKRCCYSIQRHSLDGIVSNTFLWIIKLSHKAFTHKYSQRQNHIKIST